MAFKKNSPGCPCCECVPDATHVCICGCPTAMPNTASFGDNQGTHTLTWTPGPFPAYTATVNVPGLDLWDAPLVSGGQCSHVGTGTMTIVYNLQCVTSPHVWRLTLTVGIILCGNVLHYSQTTRTTQLTNDVTFACNPSMLTFTLPTQFTSGAAPDPIAVPGGGGTITVVF